ncbi:MAG: Phosphotransferase enzyme family protein [Ilumatobacteraceae bacterium]|nr:Phosphotransferase enzyme family protein [Ilumatobacteraceae bacterium]
MDRHSQRAELSDLPTPVRAEIDRIAGAVVVESHNASGGFSPGPAARCLLEDGRLVFVKACSTTLGPYATQAHRREAKILAALGSEGLAPRLLGVVDDGEWVALVIEHIDGRMPTAPLSPTDVDALLDVIEQLGVAGTPNPVPGLAPVGSAEVADGQQSPWQLLASEADAIDLLDPWARRHLVRLVDLESSWVDAARGTTLVHGDLRADNVIIGAHRTRIVDWPSASVGAEWIDLVGLLPALHLNGGPTPTDTWSKSPIGRRAPADGVDAYLCFIAGYFTRQALRPPPPNVPALRPFQHAQGVIAREWLAERTGWS